MALIFEVKVVPSSGRASFELDKSGMIKCFLKSPPEDGKANRELIKLVAQALNVTQSEVSIVHGLTNRKKKLKIAKNLTEEELFVCLKLARQKRII